MLVKCVDVHDRMADVINMLYQLLANNVPENVVSGMMPCFTLGESPFLCGRSRRRAMNAKDSARSMGIQSRDIITHI